MPDGVPALGLHTPITNVPATESSVLGPRLSPGSLGLGNELPLEADGVMESVPHEVLESAIELTAPDISGLADVGVASFGAPPQLETVLGTDERVLIKDTRQYPWRITASLLITAADNSQWIGTAWLISPRTLATAGHCVYIRDSGIPGRDGWVKKIQVIPGRNKAELPSAACRPLSSGP
jgi:V8-like Glu-specific endopeptidase